MPLSSSVARAISFSFVWGALALVHFRRKNRDRPLERNQGVVPLEDQSAEDDISLLRAGETDSTTDQRPIWSQHETPWSMDASLLRRVWSAMGGIVTASMVEPIEPDAVDCRFADSMNIIRSIAASLGLPSNLPESFHKKLTFLRSSPNDPKPLLEEMELLTFYSKSAAFLRAVTSTDETIRLLQNITDKLECMTANLLCSDTRISPQILTNFSSDLDLLMFIDAPSESRSTPLPISPTKDNLSILSDCQFQLASFLSHLSIMPESVPILTHPCLYRWLDLWCASQDIRLQLLAMKMHFNMTSHTLTKESVQGRQEGSTPKFFLSDSSSSDASTAAPILDSPVCSGQEILGPDLFKLDFRNSNSPSPIVDVIFINGMLGSVFYTWRQKDVSESVVLTPGSSSIPVANQQSQVDCWPRAWLSEEFPQARILGVNVNLKPFVWNPISPADRLKRRIDERARDVLNQLVAAGVGQRPIIWISHSAGGILTKEILRISASFSNSKDASDLPAAAASSSDGDEANPICIRPLSTIYLSDSLNSPENSFPSSAKENISPSTSRMRLSDSIPKIFSKLTGGKNSHSSIIQRHFSSDKSLSSADQPVDSTDFVLPAGDCFDSRIRKGNVANHTIGIVFLSTPHRGNQSLMFLYQFPMTYALTPEAKQLQNSASMLNLHAWFTIWAARKNLSIMNMVETKETLINRWYSVCLVPYDVQDHDFSDVVRVHADHTSICKPRNKQDEIYIKIVDFIHRNL